MTRLWRIFKNFFRHATQGGEDRIAMVEKGKPLSLEEAAKRQKEIEREEKR
jgi:hypothetical protein